MTEWVRVRWRGQDYSGVLEDSRVQLYRGDLLAGPEPLEQVAAVEEVTFLPPVRPGKFIGLWNNFHERAAKEGLQQPPHPLYFLKGITCLAGHGDRIRRPAGYDGPLVHEGELGIVIGRRCQRVEAEEAAAYIFGYTCVNDVTARGILKSDPSFVQWTRAKGFDSFGPIGRGIQTGIDDPGGLRVQTRVNGELRQDYPVADMFYGPHEIVSRLSRDMTLEPGDVIACGTSVGAGPMEAGDEVEVRIEGVSVLRNPVA